MEKQQSTVVIVITITILFFMTIINIGFCYRTYGHDKDDQICWCYQNRKKSYYYHDDWWLNHIHHFKVVYIIWLAPLFGAYTSWLLGWHLYKPTYGWRVCVLIFGLGINWVLIFSFIPLYYCGFYVLIARIVGIKKQDLVRVLSWYEYRPWFWIKNHKQIDIKNLVVLSKFKNIIKDPLKFIGGNLYKEDQSFLIVNEFTRVDFYLSIKLKSQDFSDLIDQKFYQNVITTILKSIRQSQFSIELIDFEYDFDTKVLKISKKFSDVKWVGQSKFKDELNWRATNLLENNLDPLLKKIFKYQEWWDGLKSFQKSGFIKCRLMCNSFNNNHNYNKIFHFWQRKIPVSMKLGS